MSLKEYLDLIVEPTVLEFEQQPASVRRAFLACVVLFHTIDYISPKRPQNLRKRFRGQSTAFATIDRVAHAFKHFESDGLTPLKAKSVYSRPPAMAGVFMLGLSQLGDPTGAVLIAGETDSTLTAYAREALAFLRKQVQGLGSSSQ